MTEGENKGQEFTLEKLKIASNLENLAHKVELEQVKTTAKLSSIGDKLNEVRIAIGKFSDLFQVIIYGDKGEDRKGVVERLAFLEQKEENREKYKWVLWINLAVGLLAAIGTILVEAFKKDIGFLIKHWEHLR